MKVLEIAFTGYPVTDLKRARHFYEQVLGLAPTHEFIDGDNGWIEYDLGGGTLAISNGAPGWDPASQGPCTALEVEDFDLAVRELKAAGVPVAGVFDTPMCHIAKIADPDGNGLVIHKRKADCPHTH